VTTSGCGCDHNSARAEPFCEPLLCTLGASEQPQRAEEFRAAFTHLIATDPFPGGFRWKFRAQRGLEAQLASLAAREQDCCRFFEFQISNAGDTIVWEARATGNAAAVLEEFMRLPQYLSPTDDIDTLKRVFSGTGLAFASDADQA
jgi:hypothetical protein